MRRLHGPDPIWPSCYSIVYIATHDPAVYRFPLAGNIALYTTLLCAYYVFDSSMSQKSRFKMQQQGEVTKRNAFPQLPWGTVENPKFIQTSRGSKLLIDGWWAYLRKPVRVVAPFQMAEQATHERSIVRTTRRTSSRA